MSSNNMSEQLTSENIKVEPHDRKEILTSFLYRGWQETGEFGEQFCVELQFKNKKAALSWLKRSRINYQEVADHETLPFIKAQSNDNQP